jgi:hypothetical protein
VSINDPEYSPEPYAHAVRHLDASEDIGERIIGVQSKDQAIVEALLGIGWAILALVKHV